MSEHILRAILSLSKPALCLDFDGTLVEIAPRPDEILVDEKLPDLLQALQAQLDGRVAIVTGRTHADLTRYIDVTAFPVASSHGAEFSPAGSKKADALIASDGLVPLRPVITERIRGLPGVYVEDKGTAIAVHTRPNPDAHPDLLDHLAGEVRGHPEIHISEGKGIIEVRLAAENKGTALIRLMQLEGWEDAQPVMIGDDTTDNDGMAVAKRLGGFGIQVGQGPNGTKMSHAALRLASVTATHRLLQMLSW